MGKKAGGRPTACLPGRQVNMTAPHSIRQKDALHFLPDFRNLGVLLRILLAVNLLALAVVLAGLNWGGGAAAGQVADALLATAWWVEPLLLLVLLQLAALRDLLWRLPALPGVAAVIGLTLLTALLLHDAWQFLGLAAGGPLPFLRTALLAAGTAAMVLHYMHLRQKAAAPALIEARLQALTSRIRPHFLFNTLNAVLSLIRSEPRRAENALEELADLFRALMRDHRELVPLSDEIALCRQYLALEKLRLGERLQVVWAVADVPLDTLVPPLFLQPLIENAVYHGIEPAEAPAPLLLSVQHLPGVLQIRVANARDLAGRHAGGNQMALGNIRERLALHYDLEASLQVRETPERYEVEIRLPCRGGAPASTPSAPCAPQPEE